jgi:hypothetical protein
LKEGLHRTAPYELGVEGNRRRLAAAFDELSDAI